MRPDAYLIGLDLGQRRDYTALSVLERRAVPGTYGKQGTYDVVALHRWRDCPYTEVPAKVEAVRRGIRQAHLDAAFAETGEASRGGPAVDLVADQTGVGVAVVDLLRDAGLRPVAVTIHGGDAVIEVAPEAEYRVPKRDLAGAVQVALQRRRLRVVEGLTHAATLRGEMDNFRARIGLTGHDSYGAGEEWRDGNHDDLVLSVALALWWGEYRDKGGIDWGLLAAAAAHRTAARS
jgi:hypothetical protein